MMGRDSRPCDVCGTRTSPRNERYVTYLCVYSNQLVSHFETVCTTCKTAARKAAYDEADTTTFDSVDLTLYSTATKDHKHD